ncbi:hypothetical protein BGW37DRAFT_133953 [Umbelopsis sp. PMI_123]|nr:hypothetical protein BGW37DRAFT_133953 [Umbelopsis sp. PMI_123]
MTLKHALNGLNTTEPTSSCQTPLLGAADPISPVTTQTTSTSSIDQDGTLESSTLPAIRSKKLSKMSLSKRKPEKDNIPSSQKEQTEMKDKMMNIISQTSTSVTSKYFAITSTKAIPSSNNIETVDNPLNIGGETQQPLTTNKIISGNSEPEDRSPSFEPPLHTFSNSLSKTCSHGYDAVAKQIEQKNESADVASTLSSNHNNTTEHSANNHYSVDGVHTTPPSTNSICTTSRNPSASIAYSTIRDDSKLVNISNRFESNAIILDPPVSRKRALLSLGKSKKLKM